MRSGPFVACYAGPPFVAESLLNFAKLKSDELKNLTDLEGRPGKSTMRPILQSRIASDGNETLASRDAPLSQKEDQQLASKGGLSDLRGITFSLR
ncbi:hypothetical protein PTKIN_Ptkin16aG0075500 [Pterospermum kingtungense]